jgi:hypothetical protein
MVSYIMGNQGEGVLLFGGVKTPSNDPKTMVYSNTTVFWSCSEQEELTFLQ